MKSERMSKCHRCKLPKPRREMSHASKVYGGKICKECDKLIRQQINLRK